MSQTINEKVLRALGFKRRELDEGLFYYRLTLHRGWHIEYTDGLFELVHDGYAVPLRCRGEEHLKLLIEIL